MKKTPSASVVRRVEAEYEAARDAYASHGVDTEAALRRLEAVPLSLHCWQGDDVAGFEQDGDLGGSGLQVTGGYPGRARNGDELRADYEAALRLIPGRHRINLHAFYAETGGRRVARNELAPEHFARWMDWAADRGLGMDFNGTFFSHPLAASGFTLSHRDSDIRKFWIEHGQACRRIGRQMAARAGSPCVVNVWVPDGFKDTPADRKGPRERLRDALDEIFSERMDGVVDAVESKLFGIGTEAYVAGSHEFYLGYAATRRVALCLDMGHFHPTETVADKLSAVLLFVDRVLLHISRGLRWDSDHVPVFSDEVRALAEEMVRGDWLHRMHIGLDYFDASINRVAAWVIGARSVLKGLLWAMLQPVETLRRLEAEGDYTGRLACMENVKTLPMGAVWNAYCLRKNTPGDMDWLEEVRAYERAIGSRRLGPS